MHGEAAFEAPYHHAFEPAEIVEIGDDALAVLAGHRRQQGHPARRHIDDLARIFLLVLAHEAAEHGHRHAAVSAALGHDLDERPVRSALEQALPPFPLGFRGRSILKSGDAHRMAGAHVGDRQMYLAGTG